jgi:hypothetical protein
MPRLLGRTPFAALFLFLGTACSKSNPAPAPVPPPASASPSVAAVSPEKLLDAEALPLLGDASAPVDFHCAEPSRLVQLGTVKEKASFRGELVAGARRAYEPEHLGPREVPPLPPAPAVKLSKRYREVAGGVGLIHDDEGYTAIVEDVATRRKLTDVQACTARGVPPAFSLSSTGRFVLCQADDSTSLTESRPTHSKKRRELMEACSDGGLSLAPDDGYGVTVPTLWAFGDEPTRTSVLWCDWDAMTSREIASAPHPKRLGWDGARAGNAFGVAFCEKALFAVSLEKEIVVFRGRDATRLAGAPAHQGGDLSFSASGRYLSQSRGNDDTGWATTIYRLEP